MSAVDLKATLGRVKSLNRKQMQSHVRRFEKSHNMTAINRYSKAIKVVLQGAINDVAEEVVLWTEHAINLGVPTNYGKDMSSDTGAMSKSFYYIKNTNGLPSKGSDYERAASEYQSIAAAAKSRYILREKDAIEMPPITSNTKQVRAYVSSASKIAEFWAEGHKNIYLGIEAQARIQQKVELLMRSEDIQAIVDARLQRSKQFISS